MHGEDSLHVPWQSEQGAGSLYSLDVLEMHGSRKPSTPGWTHDDTVEPVTTAQGSQRSAGFVVGSVVAISFGTVFVLVNSGGVPAPWPLVIRVIGLLVAALLVAGLVLVVRRVLDRDTGAGVWLRPTPLLADRCASRQVRCSVAWP